jgi:hypothetical protein
MTTIKRYPTALGEGILSQTCTGSNLHGDVIERVDPRTGRTVYFVQSDKFPGRYYTVSQRPNGAWYFSGDDRLAVRYIAKVEAMLKASGSVAA